MSATVGESELLRERADNLMRVWALSLAAFLAASLAVLVTFDARSAWLIIWVGVAAGSAACATALFVGRYVLTALADAALRR